METKKRMPDWSMGVIVTLFFLFITFTGIMDFTDAVEKKSFDFRAKLAASQERNPDIELVVISEDDLSEFGRWPWSRDILAQGIHNLATAGARVIALNIMFSEPEESAGLRKLRELKDRFDDLGLAQKGPGLAFYKRLSRAEADLDNDAKLYKAIKDAGNVVLPVYFDLSGSGVDTEAPAFIARHSIKRVRGLNDESAAYMIWVKKLTPLLPSLAEVACCTGHNNLFPDEDGYIRTQVHVLGYMRNILFPSYPVAIVKTYQGLQEDDVAVSAGEGISLRSSPSSIVRVPVTDYAMKTLIRWNAGPGIAFHRTPFSKVYKNEIRSGLFKDKIVIIGPTAPGIGDRFVTPVSGQLPGIEVVANAVSNILDQEFYSRPGWVHVLEFGLLILFGLFISFVLPGMSAGIGAVTTLALFLGYGIAGTILFFSNDLWIKISPAMILLAVGYILVVSKKFLITERTKERVEADSVETNRMLGLSFQQQGMLDLALEKFRKLPLHERGTKDLLYNLGLDFERKRQFSKALSTYGLVIEDGQKYKDLKERIPKLKGAEATMIFGTGSGGHPGDIGATLMDMDTRPTLGRYEIVDELGRGAMGVVYKGEDPKIHRTVAIKTVRLSDFDEDMLDEMKERFFREAESAGLLTHPNIVTIYDAGEEHDLAYIAMEFLQGRDLEENTKNESLFPLREVLSIIAQVADALDYAHGKGIVHRDIKPANIMRIEDSQEVKVTDFGIARITASSKTKTGVIMGTPSYMSPEQIAGKKVDGRSDIFSLGVVLFELLCGQKPFAGEDMTSLMYRIAREKHPSVRTLNPRVPGVVEQIIDKALEKEPGKRYQKAGQMTGHLKKVIARIDEIQEKKRAVHR